MTAYLKTGLAIFVSVGILFAIVRFGGGSFLPSITGDIPPESSGMTGDSELIGGRAPYFDLPDGSGDHVRLSDYTDTPLIILFWSTWNADASDQMKILDDYLGARAPEERLVQILAISSQEERSIVASFMRRGGYRVKTLVDAQGITSEEYRIKSLPTFYFVDRSGIVREAYAGLLNERMIGDKVEGILQ